MSVTTLRLTAHDPIIARDGRPFGIGEGGRMRGLGWPLPSVVAGSLRTALVKESSGLNFSGDMPQRLMAIEVAGVFPTVGDGLYLPAPNDCVWDEKTKKVHRVRPIPLKQSEGVDFPLEGLDPVRLTEQQAGDDFKAKAAPAWWPSSKYAEWLTATNNEFPPDWFDASFLNAATMETRDHVCLDANRGAAAEGLLFATAGLNVTHLSRFGVGSDDRGLPFDKRFAAITLSARVTIPVGAFEHVETLDAWHALGGERRLVHWRRSEAADLWKCPDAVRSALEGATRIRMVLTTPAIFSPGLRPGWLDAITLTGKPFEEGPRLKLVGVSTARWKAVSGWSLRPHRDTGRPGPKPTRRMVPAGGVYFFEKVEGHTVALADRWLQPVSDGEQERRDGFGLAVWGTWERNN
jgi:CRISPR-associated protein Cmr3